MSMDALHYISKQMIYSLCIFMFAICSVMEAVPLCVPEDVDRFVNILEAAIADGSLKHFRKFDNTKYVYILHLICYSNCCRRHIFKYRFSQMNSRNNITVFAEWASEASEAQQHALQLGVCYTKRHVFM